MPGACKGAVNPKKKLTDRRKHFVDVLLTGVSAAEAARQAGYSQKTANAQAPELLAQPCVQEYLQQRIADRARRTEITQDYVLTTIRDTVERCRQAEPVLDREGNPTGEYKFEAHAVLKGCELLGKHLAMWTDKHELNGANGGPIRIAKLTLTQFESAAKKIAQDV